MPASGTCGLPVELHHGPSACDNVSVPARTRRSSMWCFYHCIAQPQRREPLATLDRRASIRRSGGQVHPIECVLPNVQYLYHQSCNHSFVVNLRVHLTLRSPPVWYPRRFAPSPHAPHTTNAFTRPLIPMTLGALLGAGWVPERHWRNVATSQPFYIDNRTAVML